MARGKRSDLDSGSRQIGKWLVLTYLLLVALSMVPILTADPGESLAGIFLVMFSLPWSSLVPGPSVALVDTALAPYATLLLGVLVNSLLLYFVPLAFGRLRQIARPAPPLGTPRDDQKSPDS